MTDAAGLYIGNKDATNSNEIQVNSGGSGQVGVIDIKAYASSGSNTNRILLNSTDLTISPNLGDFDISLGSNLTSATITDSRGTTTGLEYAADYSADFTDKSLIDLGLINSTSTGKGASLIGIEDSGTLFVATDVEGALAEVMGDLDSHEANNGSDHSYIDQDVTSGSSPTFDAANFTGIDAANVDIADAGGIFTATDVEAALQEVKELADDNTLGICSCNPCGHMKKPHTERIGLLNFIGLVLEYNF